MEKDIRIFLSSRTVYIQCTFKMCRKYLKYNEDTQIITQFKDYSRLTIVDSYGRCKIQIMVSSNPKFSYGIYDVVLLVI